MNNDQNWSQNTLVDNTIRTRGFFRLRVRGGTENEQQRLEEVYDADPKAAIESSSQFHNMAAAALKVGLTLRAGAVALEFGTSAALQIDDRPVLKTLAEAAERGEFDVLVISRPEDLWRSVDTCVALLERLRKAEVRLFCAQNGYLLGDECAMPFVLLGHFESGRVYVRKPR